MTPGRGASPAGPLATLREAAEALGARPPWSRVSMIGLIGFVLASPFSISLSQIFVYTAIAAWLVSLWREGRPDAGRFPLGKPFALFACLTLLSAAVSEDPARSLTDAKQLFQILIFYCAIHTVADAREGVWLVKALLAAAAAVSAYTLGAALLNPLGLANRMSGFFSIYMTLGGYLLIAGALAFAYTVVSGGARGRWWIVAAGVLIAAAMLTTFSRNAWIGFGASAVCAAAAARSVKGGALIAGFAALVLILSPAPVRKRIWSIGDLQDTTARERIFMWESGMRMVRDRPLFGTGLDMIKRTYTRYAHPAAVKKRTGHLHNNLLQIAAERGVPALAAWVWIMALFFWEAARRLRKLGEAPFERRFLAAGGLAAVAGFFVAGLFEYNYGDSEVVMLAYLAMALPFMGGEREAASSGAG